MLYESDDWGSIRIPSKRICEKMVKRNVIHNNPFSHYYLYDALESNDDLAELFEVIASFTDMHGNHPVLRE